MLDDTYSQAREYLQRHGLSGWLLYDYRGMNPIVEETLGPLPNVTRPVWVWVPADGDPLLLASFVDQGRFDHLKTETSLFINRRQMAKKLEEILSAGGKIAMEYSPGGALPRASKVDAGTLEMVRGFGVEVVSSADLVQFATQRWTSAQLESHRKAALGLDRIVHDAFSHVGEHLGSGLNEYELAEFIRTRYQEEGLEASDGPVVAVNQHSSDPHFGPKPEGSALIETGAWLLIDLWARLPDADATYADITWTGFVGEEPGLRQREVFDIVTGARDAALAETERAFNESTALQGWQLDRVARNHITEAGYGDYFNHRLGHSLGREAHGNAVNLDGWETFDTRELIPGIAVTLEPGVYLPQFGVRSEIDVFISETGPEVTTEVQKEIVLIGR